MLSSGFYYCHRMDLLKTHDCIPIPYLSGVLGSLLSKEANILDRVRKEIADSGNHDAKALTLWMQRTELLIL